MAAAVEELGAMRLSEAQAGLLRFFHERFPTPYRDAVETVNPRAKYQPPMRREALDMLGIDPAMWDDSIAFLTTHELVREVYRHGTEEYSAMMLAPGHVVRAPIARGSPPPDADPADEPYQDPTGFSTFFREAQGKPGRSTHGFRLAESSNG